jgi:L-seryl-tRNA(Ser) seleniumtransferase
MPDLSQLPAVDQLLNHPHIQVILETYGRTLTLSAIRSVLEDIRLAALEESKSIPHEAEIISQIRITLEEWLSPTLFPVINATGVILHTNLGRAPLSVETRQAMSAVSGSYSNLEFNMATGKRGKRDKHASRLLSRLTGTEAGFVVNNNAGAVLLALSALAAGKKVLVSRTQLVEIGGGFRVPDVMRQSGAQLFEIGTTNRVHLYDFENALAEGDAALVLVAHHSNFKVVGFHSEPDLEEIVRTAHRHNVPVIHDIGSGALLDTAAYGLAHEPTVLESIRAGCDLVCFSGDKLLGGPQAGIIIGREEWLAPIRKHPLARALRADKLTLSGLSATLLHYLRDEAEEKIPIWRMIARPLSEIQTAAENWRQYLGEGQVVTGFSTVGGGSLPTEEMPTYHLALTVSQPDAFLADLRQSHPPIIARIENDRVLLDPRTVFPEQEAALLRNLMRILSSTGI